MPGAYLHLCSSAGVMLTALICTGALLLRRQHVSRGTWMTAAIVIVTTIWAKCTDAQLATSSESSSLSILRIGSCVLLATFFLLPLLLNLRTERHFRTLLLTMYLACLIPMLLLSVAYEMIFFSLLALQVLAWIFVEGQSQQAVRMNSHGNESDEDATLPFFSADKALKASNEASPLLRSEDLRITLTLLFLAHVAFFGMNDLASMAHIQLPSAERFISSPVPNIIKFALLGIKCLVPLLLLAAAFGIAAGVSIKASRLSDYFLIALASTDVMTLSFFYNVTSENGSWLDMGLSAARFLVANALICMIAPMALLARFFSQHHWA